jgi:DNA-binding MarR family transcriptional regulator
MGRQRKAVTGRSDQAAGQVAEELQGLLTAVVHGVPRDLSLTALSTLANVGRNGPRRITDLASTEGVTQPSMTTLVTNLQRAGYLERRSQPGDGRVTLVAITASGMALLDSRRRAGADSLRELIKKLPRTEVMALHAAIPAIAHLRALDELRRYPV